jgi:hypothetical protein
MKRFLLWFILCLSTKNIWSQNASDWLQLANTNHKLLNELLWDGINDMRIQKGIAPLEKNNHLVQLNKIYHSELEFKRFIEPQTIERSIKRSIYNKAFKMGFTAGIIDVVCSENYAINYDEKKEFFYDFNNKETELNLFYGPIKKSERKNAQITQIPHHTYQSFVNHVLQNLSAQQKKVLLNPVFKWGEAQFQWNYKSLHKNKTIPTIKLIFLVASYQTALMR